jgi:hypothetical protein
MEREFIFREIKTEVFQLRSDGLTVQRKVTLQTRADLIEVDAAS